MLVEVVPGSSDHYRNRGQKRVLRGDPAIEIEIRGVVGHRDGRARIQPFVGPERLVAFVVPSTAADASEATLLDELEQLIRSRLNPLFKLSEIVFVDALPRTASNKVMRRALRERVS